MKTIKYFSFYIDDDHSDGRNSVLASKNKIDYIIKAINKSNVAVNLISGARSTNGRKQKGYFIKLNQHNTLRVFFSFSCKNWFSKFLSVVWIRLNILIELLKTKKGEKIIVYHSLAYMNVVKLAHRIKRFHLILEVEEIYSDVDRDIKKRKKEVAYISTADSYIFPTEILREKTDCYKKRSVIIYGVYDVEKRISSSYNDGMIHCVYAGTLDSRKGGASAAVAAAKYLPCNYHIHILGFGSQNQLDSLKNAIIENKSEETALVTYDGLLKGKAFISAIQSCHIGLSTQFSDADFNDTSFPSKILTYLCNGLKVVSVRIPVIEKAAISDEICFYEGKDPKNIAEAIMKVDVSRNTKCDLILKLDVNFQKEIRELIDDCIH